MKQSLTSNIFQTFLFLAVTLFAGGSHAMEAQNFSLSEFEKAQKQGASIVVDVYADWCPTCKQQKKDLSAFFGSGMHKDVKFYKLNYDNKDLVNAFSKSISRPIPRQSTIVVLKGSEVKEVSVAQTKDKLSATLKKALAP